MPRLLVLGLLIWAPGVVHADAGQSAVVRVGKQQLGVADLQARIEQLPGYQLQSLGNSPESITQGFVQAVVVPELLVAAEAQRLKLESSLAVQVAQREVLRGALVRALRAELNRTRPVTDEEVSDYYKKHENEYRRPERLRLFRILVASKAKATEVLKLAKSADLAKWRELARERSLDAATKERGGDLGFVRADGATDVPRVEVDPALFEAASTVENGEFVDHPVQEGKQFAVIWRRGSLAPSARTLEREAVHIRRLLEEARLDDKLDALLAAESRVERSNLALLEEVQFAAAGAGEAAPRPAAAPAGSAQPDVDAGERGQR
jgi:peptidyl-prolyl cis-trans isomerase C